MQTGTELKNCVNGWFEKTYGKKKRKYHYITMLRDPVPRFISEWMHVRRGATWKTAALKCNGREATLEEVPFCYDSQDWQGVTLQEFLDCPHNLAFNRQTRMLANLTVVGCYDPAAFTPARRAALLLASAKRNLRRMAYFGLVELQGYSQFLFERTLGMSFQRAFMQHNRTHSSQGNVSAGDLNRIARLNALDVELYQYAKDLFLQRVRRAREEAGLPVSEELERLIGQQAVTREEEGEEEEGEGGYVLSEQVAGSRVSGDDDVLAKKANDLTEDIVRGKLLQRNQRGGGGGGGGQGGVGLSGDDGSSSSTSGSDALSVRSAGPNKAGRSEKGFSRRDLGRVQMSSDGIRSRRLYERTNRKREGRLRRSRLIRSGQV